SCWWTAGMCLSAAWWKVSRSSQTAFQKIWQRIRYLTNIPETGWAFFEGSHFVTELMLMAAADRLRRYLYEGSDLSGLIHFMVKGGLGKSARDEVSAATAAYVSRDTEAIGLSVDRALSLQEQAVYARLNESGY